VIRVSAVQNWLPRNHGSYRSVITANERDPFGHDKRTCATSAEAFSGRDQVSSEIAGANVFA